MSGVTFAKRTARVTSAPDAAADAPAPGPLRGRCVLAATVALAGGCIPLAAPRLPQEVGAAIADNPMRRLETDDMLALLPGGPARSRRGGS